MGFGYAWAGSVNNTNMYTSNPGEFLYSDPIAMPVGRLAANGLYPIYIASIFAGYITPGTGYVAISYQGVVAGNGSIFGNSGGTFQFRMYRTAGTMYVGRNTGAGGTTYWSSGGSLGGTMPGSISYETVPSAPVSALAVSNLPGQATVSWGSPGDHGQSALIGYTVQRADDAAFSVNVVTTNVAVSSSYVDNTVTPGKRYRYRIYARNGVSALAGTHSVPSNITTVDVLAGGRRWDGSAEIATSSAVRYDGSAEIALTTAVRWDGSAEVPLT